MPKNQNINTQIVQQQIKNEILVNDKLGADETINHNEPKKQVKTKIVKTAKKEGCLSKIWNGISAAFTVGTAVATGYLANSFRNSEENLNYNMDVDTYKVTGICENMAHEKIYEFKYPNAIAEKLTKRCYEYGYEAMSRAICYDPLSNTSYNCYKVDNEFETSIIKQSIKSSTKEIIRTSCTGIYPLIMDMLEKLYAAEKVDCITKEKNVANNVDATYKAIFNKSLEMYRTAYKKIDGLNSIIASGYNITTSLAVLNGVWACINIVKGGVYGLTLLKNKFSKKSQDMQNANAEIGTIKRNGILL